MTRDGRHRKARARRGWFGAMIVLAVVGVVAYSSAAGGTPSVRSETILLVPPVNAGGVGWCVVTLREASRFGGCPYSRSRLPIVAQTWETASFPTVTTAVAVTTSEVVAVSALGSGPLATHAESVLPSGLRAVMVEIPGENLADSRRDLSFTPLDALGAPLPQAARRSPPLERYVAIRSFRDPAGRPRGVCAIRGQGLDGLTAREGSVISEIRAYPGLIGEAFVACSSTSYILNGWPILASVRVDAAQPGRAPASLPDMKNVAGHPGVFQAPGEEGPQVARRVAGGWLVVSKGAGLQQRLTLLKHLSATGVT
jgi:hypothetical protein